jgi:hypothetical protein
LVDAFLLDGRDHAQAFAELSASIAEGEAARREQSRVAEARATLEKTLQALRFPASSPQALASIAAERSALDRERDRWFKIAEGLAEIRELKQCFGSNAEQRAQETVALVPALEEQAASASQALAHFYAGQQPPVIALQPTNQVTPENVTVTFYSAAYGAGTLGYQWYLSDGFAPITPVAGQTSQNLSFTTTAAQSGNFYQLIVTNQYGASTGAVAQLNVVAGTPTFFVDLNPADTFAIGHIIRLHVSVGGTAPFTYQWRRNGVNVSNGSGTSGATTASLTISNVLAAKVGRRSERELGYAGFRATLALSCCG